MKIKDERLNNPHFEDYADKVYDESLKPAIIVDLDGTVALFNDRDPYDYESCVRDVPNKPLCDLINEISAGPSEVKILFVTGREDSGTAKNKTISWLLHKCGFYNYGSPYKQKLSDEGPEYDWELFMRKPGDRRPDNIVKAEIYKYKIEPHYNVMAVFEDRDSVVKMWRDLGLLCCQVYYGDF